MDRVSEHAMALSGSAAKERHYLLDKLRQYEKQAEKHEHRIAELTSIIAHKTQSNVELLGERDRLKAELARYQQLLRVADCPQQCDNGAVPYQVADDDWDCYPCQFCHERSELLPPEPEQ